MKGLGWADEFHPTNNSPAFSKGDRWCAIGDSITHQGRYLEPIYLYYLTRFPEDRFRLFNCGCGGDTAAGTLRRMDTDILVHQPTVATVMLGMNDIWWKNNKLIGPRDYLRDLTRIVDQLQQANCRVILCTSSPYDASVRSGNQIDPLRQGLDGCVQQMRELAATREIPVVDIFEAMSEIAKRGQAANPDFTMQIADRTHPTAIGGLVMAYTFLRAMRATPLVSKIGIDNGAGKFVEQTNCAADNLSCDRETISFSCL
jgi:hypothetical protein